MPRELFVNADVPAVAMLDSWVRTNHDFSTNLLYQPFSLRLTPIPLHFKPAAIPLTSTNDSFPTSQFIFSTSDMERARAMGQPNRAGLGPRYWQNNPLHQQQSYDPESYYSSQTPYGFGTPFHQQYQGSISPAPGRGSGYQRYSHGYQQRPQGRNRRYSNPVS